MWKPNLKIRYPELIYINLHILKVDVLGINNELGKCLISYLNKNKSKTYKIRIKKISIK